MRSSTPAGLTWFATTTALARAQGASDVRPYVLLSSWASSIPGVRSTDFLTEENRHPVYGEDNLSDPWTNPGIRLLQKACAPLLALDIEFWKDNRRGDAWGHFPVHCPQVSAGSTVTRKISVFNDEFSGTEMELSWSVREGSPSNRAYDEGQIQLEIACGSRCEVPVTFTAPACNTHVFLMLKVSKDSTERFCDDLTCFEVTGGADFKPEFAGEEKAFL